VILTFFQVAICKYVDDVSVLAVEHMLVQKLPTLFSSDTVCDMDEKAITDLAEESKESVSERVRVAEKLKVLEEGMAQLTRLNRGTPVAS